MLSVPSNPSSSNPPPPSPPTTPEEPKQPIEAEQPVPFSPRFPNQIGAFCHFHQQERPTPACIITDAKGERIIATSSDLLYKEPAWVLRSVTVTLTRLWSSSAAVAYLTASVPHLPQLPPQVPHGLHPEQQIAIYLGYIEGPRGLGMEDIQENRLLRVFIGVIDTLTAACTGKVGYSLKIQCRDRVKWFMDSSLIFNLTEDEQSLFRLQQNKPGIDRAEGIWFILNSAVGRTGSICTAADAHKPSNACDPACIGCGVKLERGDFIRPSADSQPQKSISSYFSEKLRGRVTNIPATDPYNVLTNIYVTRPHLGAQNHVEFLLLDSSAIETIKRLSYMEVFPTDFFQDPHTGQLYYVPRGIDTTGLEDPNRFYRTYYVRYIPEGMEVKDINQMVLSYREDLSSINLRTNIVVGSANDSGSGDHVVHFKAAPKALRSIPHACRYAMYQDSSVASIAESAYIALALSREQGRLLRSVDMSVLGDPSFALSEVLQIISSPLDVNDKGSEGKHRDAAFYKQDREAFQQWVTRADQYLINAQREADVASTASKEQQLAKIPSVGKMADGSDLKVGQAERNTDVACSPDVWVNSDDPKDSFYLDDVPSMWRVNSIIHHFKATGFVTQLSLEVPF